jgi:hypothetical protein
MNLRCHYCFDPATSCGPRGRGTEAVALLRYRDTAAVFCSPECRDMWLTVVGNATFDADDYDDLALADDVDPETIRPDASVG